MDLSIVIPLYNEDESLAELHSKIVSCLSDSNLNYEIIFIDDGSKDKSWSVLKKVANNYKNTTALRFLTNYGKSMALSAGFKFAKGSVVVTMDADLQDEPNEIILLYRILYYVKFDLLSAWKK